MADEGLSIKEIVRRTGRSRNFIRRLVRGRGEEVFRSRSSTLTPYLDRLEDLWVGGCHNGAELWRQMGAAGFPGGIRVVTEWATRRRLNDNPSIKRRLPSARALVILLTQDAADLSIADAITVAMACEAAPTVVTARDLLLSFHALVRRREPVGLDAWLKAAAEGPLASFANGVVRDLSAVRAAMTGPWSNGQTEGQVNRLKLVKRQMFGRAKLDLLRARLIGALA